MTDEAIDEKRTGYAKMRARARLISLLGDELISDERVAVVELVKNAYDADASHVDVTFSGDNPLRPDVLTVSDDGSGMSLETVLSAWFEPGTIGKKETLQSPGGRRYQGAKGVGRFAAARLAKSLYMETRRAGDDEGVVVLLDWGQFDDTRYLDEVEIHYETRVLPHLKHGTILEISGLREKKEWTEGDFGALHDRLSRLISPFGEVKDFKINLAVPGRPELTGEVAPHALTQNPKGSRTNKGTKPGAGASAAQAFGKQSCSVATSTVHAGALSMN